MSHGCATYTTSTIFLRRTPVLMNNCALWQLVKRTFLILSSNQVSVRHKTLKKESVWERKSSSFSKFFWAILMLRWIILEAFQIRTEALVGNNIVCQWLECYYRSFWKGHLSYLKERPSIRKDQMSKFQNSQNIPEQEKLSHFKVKLNNKR